MRRPTMLTRIQTGSYTEEKLLGFVASHAAPTTSALRPFVADVCMREASVYAVQQ